ncbi:mucin-5AC-like isoform X2 [Penaeus monodon]|uniref:mucin-5AC-like isoform X2 n=1 Tax=Penaeus monodon TaxID=6687 RepID=UPI0018A6F8A2|nr:mucin-5AC-like isoform X2 [Penaeus monodon]
MNNLVRRAALACLLLAFLCCNSAAGQHPTLPILDMDNLPATNFTCKEKVIGGYYADVYTGCQMFHVCTLDEKGEIHDYKFRCLMGTVFDQETRVCERADDVDCSKSESFFHLNNELYGPGIIPSSAIIRISDTIDDPTAIGEHASAASSTTTQPPFVFPVTSFSCHDKIPGGLYADVETGCVVFHICSVEPDSSTKDNKFVCGVGTLFDQTTRTCQAEREVDCARSPSLYYLNDPLRGPDDAVDLCRWRPLGSPLADLTSQCHDYTVCEQRGDGSLVERRLPCKKDFLFSQLRRRCVPEKKVNCAKETLGEILGLGGARQSPSGSSSSSSRRRRAASLLLSHRFRRAALTPLANLVPTHAAEDARVRRALYSLAALQQWAQENARHTAFINVYTLNTRGKEGYFPKKASGAGGQQEGRRYGYISRSKRDVNNATVAEQALHQNGTKVAELSPDAVSSPTDVREEIRPNPSVIGVAPKMTVVRHTSAPGSGVPPVSSTVSSAVPSLLTTLSTLTISGASTRTSKTTTSTTTVTVTPFTVTITTTETKIIPTETATVITSQASGSPTSTIAPSLTETTPLPTMTQIPEIAPPVNVADVGSATVVSSSPSETKPEAVTPVTEASSSTPSVPQEASISQEGTTTAVPDAQNTNITTSRIETEVSSTVATTTVSSSTESSAVEAPVNSKAENTTSATTESSAPQAVGNSTTETTTVSSSTEPTVTEPAVNSTEVKAPESVPEASTTTATTTTTTTTTVASASTSGATVSPPPATSPPEGAEPALEDAPSANATATTSQPPDFMVPEGSVNVSTTVVPGEGDTLANGTLVQPTPAPPTLGTYTRDNLPETSFTCKDKQLEQFYPDPEANCQVFHYCSLGFIEQQVLDLKFLCTGATMFNIKTQKCEDMANVTCSFNDTTTTPPPPTEPSTIATEPSTTTTTTVTTTTTTTEITTHSSSTTVATTTTTRPELSTSKTPVNTTEAPSATTGAPSTTLAAIGDPTEAPATTTEAPTTTTGTPHEGHHHNWNATRPDVEAAKNESVAEEKTAEIEPVETTTLEPEVREVTEVELPETETVTDRVAREEVSTSTEGLEFTFETTTEYFLVEEPEINTELGPIVLAPSSAEEPSVGSTINPETSETPASTTTPVTEFPTDVSTQESISPQTPAPTETTPLTEEVALASEELESSIVSIARNASNESNHTASTSTEASQTEAAL